MMSKQHQTLIAEAEEQNRVEKYAEAEATARTVLSASGIEPLIQAQALRALSESLLRRGMAKEALAYAEESVDVAIKAWQLTIGNTKSGGGLPPVGYKKNIVIQQLGQDGLSVIRTWICEGAWPQKRNGIDFDRKSSENTMESIEFCTDEVMEP
jgi:pyruvate kinase